MEKNPNDMTYAEYCAWMDAKMDTFCSENNLSRDDLIDILATEEKRKVSEAEVIVKHK